MKLLVDMNLSPRWIPVLEKEGWTAVHWSAVGDSSASDQEIMSWARSNGYVVVTHDLDFGAILAATKTESPSVVQLRTQDVNPHHAASLLLSVLSQFKAHLEQGALISVDEKKARARVLPLNG